MSYIIVWRDSHKEPHINIDGHNFKESYSSYDQAKEDADKIEEIENDGEMSPWYFDYKIYKEVDE